MSPGILVDIFKPYIPIPRLDVQEPVIRGPSTTVLKLVGYATSFSVYILNRLFKNKSNECNKLRQDYLKVTFLLHTLSCKYNKKYNNNNDNNDDNNNNSNDDNDDSDNDYINNIVEKHQGLMRPLV